jgi:hypothetical protein
MQSKASNQTNFYGKQARDKSSTKQTYVGLLG